MKTIKTTLFTTLFILSVMFVNAQITLPKTTTVKDVKLNNKPKVVKPIFPKADKTIMDLIDNASDGTFFITMVALKLSKSNNGKNWSYSTVSTTNNKRQGYFKKFDKLTAEGNFYVNDPNRAASVKIYTTKLGGKKIEIMYAEGKNSGRWVKIGNIKIIKKGLDKYIITGDSENNKSITNYIFNIFRYVEQ